jgi:chromate reductase
MSRPLHLVTLVGSLRQGSYNHAIARALPGLAPEGVTISELGSVGDFPHYNQDENAKGFPAAVTAMGEAIRQADGIIIVSPEYNYSMPGVLKNALDWLSRLPEQPFVGKPVAIQSASMGPFGGARMQYHLRQTLVFLDGRVLNKPEVMVGLAQTKIDAAGQIVDKATSDFIAGQLKAFAEFVRRS